jgi:hypothetical protein
MTSFIVTNEAVLRRQQRQHIIPNAQITAQRIDKNQGQARRSPFKFAMQRYLVNGYKVHQSPTYHSNVS